MQQRLKITRRGKSEGNAKQKQKDGRMQKTIKRKVQEGAELTKGVNQSEEE